MVRKYPQTVAELMNRKTQKGGGGGGGGRLRLNWRGVAASKFNVLIKLNKNSLLTLCFKLNQKNQHKKHKRKRKKGKSERLNKSSRLTHIPCFVHRSTQLQPSHTDTKSNSITQTDCWVVVFLPERLPCLLDYHIHYHFILNYSYRVHVAQHTMGH